MPTKDSDPLAGVEDWFCVCRLSDEGGKADGQRAIELPAVRKAICEWLRWYGKNYPNWNGNSFADRLERGKEE